MRQQFRAAVAQCDCRTHLIIDTGRAIVIRDGGNVELPNSTFDAEVEKFKSAGCAIMHTHVFLKVAPAGSRRLVELPTGHVVPI